MSEKIDTFVERIRKRPLGTVPEKPRHLLQANIMNREQEPLKCQSSKAYRAFDTEAPLGVLKRFHFNKTEVVDLTKSDGQMRVFDTLKDAQVTIIDVRAGLLSPTLKTLAEIGFLDGVKGVGGAAASNQAAATPNRAVRMAGRCGVGQTARLCGR